MRYLLFLLLPIVMAFDAALDDPKLEKRALALMNEIRCVACENEPISQSNADIAEDMRSRVREMIASGATDAEVRLWFAERYGEFVLFRPSTSGSSGLILWSVPFGLLLLGAAGLGLSQRRRGSADAIEAVAPEEFDATPGAPTHIDPDQADIDAALSVQGPDTQS